MLTIEQSNALRVWDEAKRKLDAAKEAEMEARTAAVNLFFPNGHVPKGTNNFDLGDGWEAKFTGVLNFKVDDAAAKVAVQALASQGEKGALVAERLFRWEPKLSVTEYNQLPPEFMPLVLPAITSSPGTPQLEIKQRKRK
jgi:hypothetical protein